LSDRPPPPIRVIRPPQYDEEEADEIVRQHMLQRQRNALLTAIMAPGSVGEKVDEGVLKNGPQLLEWLKSLK
jgi:hypothetical protein